MKPMTNTVLAELEEFRVRILPTLAERDPVSFGEFKGDKLECHGPRHTLSDWQEAAARLTGFLEDHRDDKSIATELSRLSQFMRGGQAGGDYVIENGVIYWRLSIFASVKWEEGVHGYLPVEYRPESVGGVEQSRFAVRRWFESADTGDISFWNALCMSLPALVDHDPKFAMQMLLPSAYRDRILSDEALTPFQQQAELEKVDKVYFGHVLNNALLHVIAALANNHFQQIHEFLQVPNFSGRYTDLIPHYLFAILFAKIEVLSRLSKSDD